MIPQVSNLVETFMAMTGTCVSSHIIRECWPLSQEETPQQDLNGIREVIVHRLDKVATHCWYTMAWDRFTYPQTKEKHWKEEVLLHYPRKVLDVRACMPGFKLMMQNEEGHYGNATNALKFKGHMFIYDPQKDISQWVLVQGVSASLMSSELRSANDLNNMNPYPYDRTGLVKPYSPMLVKGVPAGGELVMHSYDEPSDSGEEWDKTNVAIGNAALLCLWGKVPHGQKPLLRCGERSS